MAALSRSPKVIPTTTNPLPAAAVAVPKKISQPGLGVQLLTAGSAACIADLITFPLDTVKVRLQVSNIHEKSSMHTMVIIIIFLCSFFRSRVKPGPRL